MIASNVMTKEPITLSYNAKVKDAIDLFRSTKFQNLPVIDDQGRPVGSVSALSTLHAAVPAYADEKLLAIMEGGPDIVSVYRKLEKIFDLPVTDIMDKNIHPVHAGTPTSSVAARLINQGNQTTSVFVIDHEGVLIGLISAVDIISRTST